MLLNATIPEIPSGAPTASTVALLSLWIAIRDWPRRAYYVAVTAVVVLGFAVSSSGAGLLAPNWTLGTIFLLTGVAFLGVGLLDHALLVKLTHDVRQSQSQSQSQLESESQAQAQAQAPGAEGRVGQR